MSGTLSFHLSIRQIVSTERWSNVWSWDKFVTSQDWRAAHEKAFGHLYAVRVTSNMPSRQASGTVVSQIEAMLESVLVSLSRHEPAMLNLASKRTEHDFVETIRFPGTTFVEARKFGELVSSRSLSPSNQGRRSSSTSHPSDRT